MKMTSILFALTLSFSVLAGDRYQLLNATCDGTAVATSTNDALETFILDFSSNGAANLEIAMSGAQDGMDYSVQLITPVLFTALANGNYNMVANGSTSCTLTTAGHSIDCSNDVQEMEFPKEEFRMSKTNTTLSLNFVNYTDEDVSCSNYSLNFSRI